MVKKHYCHAPSHFLPKLIGIDSDDVHSHLMRDHREDVGTKEKTIKFIECYIEEVEC